jgi:hypothetical protein
MVLCSLAAVVNYARADEGGEDSALFHKSLTLPTGQVVVLEEQSLEPRSVGSYALRLYSGANPDAPYDDFLMGTIRPRDGMIEDISLVPVHQCKQCVMITLRSAGSGSYRSVEFLSYTESDLIWRLGLRGLPADMKLPPSEFRLSF